MRLHPFVLSPKLARRVKAFQSKPVRVNTFVTRLASGVTLVQLNRFAQRICVLAFRLDRLDTFRRW